MPETSGEKDGGAEARAARIGSARADFVGSLGRRVGELRTILNGLEQDSGSPRLRDDLRRRVHALSAGARLLRFAGMATALAEAERMLERAASVGGLGRSELREIAQIFDHLPSYAENEPAHEERATERPPASPTIGETGTLPPTILVIGPSGLADAITHTIDHPGENEIECERCDTTTAGLELARVLAPDVAVIDADLPGAQDLVEKLAKDSLTEPIALILVGTWATPEEGARWVAAGAALTLSKPVSPHDLRKACLELCNGTGEPLHSAPLGEATVEQLTSLIINEVKRGLPDALVQGRSIPIQLGDGSDILGAVWGAVARVRDLLMVKSGGAVRFSTQGPEGALPIAPWWGDSPASPLRASDARREVAPRLDGRRVVVADDDPAVTWFIGGLLRAAGAEVREAHDGDRALELCFRLAPDLVISDVLMPGLDGFALCRALKRDLALRDVPVILLSWKEDLLQRLRDLGADADGYLRKEASAAAILQRVNEVLRTRVRIETRLKGEGEVRGRLDGVTPTTLLRTIGRVRPDSRLCIRDASFLYEAEIRGGDPKSATRTTSDGSFQRGKEVFAALLGIRTGRYVVSPAEGVARGTLDGDLASQLELPLAHARAAFRLLGGTRILEVNRVTIALDRVLAYLGATPEPARSLLYRLAKGASPRDLILGSEVAAADMEQVLCDLAARGAVVGIEGALGTDLLGPALEKELNSIRRGGTPSHPPKWQTSRSGEREAVSAHGVGPRQDPTLPAPIKPPGAPDAKPATTSSETVPAIPVIAVLGRVNVLPSQGRHDSAPRIEAAELPVGWPDAPDADDHAPSSLEAALIRQISDRTPAPTLVSAIDDTASIVNTSELKTRASATPPVSIDSPGAIPSLPPDAIVPGSTSEEKIRATPELALAAAIVPATPSDNRIGTTDPSTIDVLGQTALDDPPPVPSRVSSVPSIPLPREAREQARQPPPRKGPGKFPLGLVVALAALAAVVFLLRTEGEPERGARLAGPAASALGVAPKAPGSAEIAPAPMAPIASAASAPSPSTSSTVGSEPSADAGVLALVGSAAASASATSPSGEDLPLPAGAVIAPGQGLLDIETGARESIFVDGVELGRGPFLRLTLSPGVHEVRLRAHGEERIRFVLIRTARRTRLPLSSVWAR